MASGKRLRDEDIPSLLDSVINETNSDYSESEEDIFGDDDSESNSDASDSEPPRPTVAAFFLQCLIVDISNLNFYCIWIVISSILSGRFNIYDLYVLFC